MKFDFEDINLVPKLCRVNSRSECDTSVTFGNKKFKLPVVPANMQSVIDEALAMKLAQNGFFYILHRFDVDVVKFISDMKEKNLVTSISIGVNQDSYELLDELIQKNLIPDFITIDIAHGHSIKMKEMLNYVKSKKIDSFIIAGNISSEEAVYDLTDWGADAIKVGIGPGCFISETEIITKSGIKKIEEVGIGDFVLTHKNRYEEVISKTSYYEEDDLIKINDTISTKDHKYYVINKEDESFVSIENYEKYAKWVSAIDLDINNHLLLGIE